MRSPFTGLKSAALEIKNFRASGWLMFSICAVAMIPLIYAGLFLLAFLDPYGSLSNVPAVVVNQDRGAIISEEEVNIGNQLCDKLIEGNEEVREGQATGFDWQFVSSTEEARQGLEDGTYYMELIIPENFSESIASADGDNPQQAELQVFFNPSTNLIAQTVGSSMVTKIKAELNAIVGQTYYENIFLSVSEASDSLLAAVEGSGEIANGIDTASDGASELASGAGQIQSGSAQLGQGINQAADGSQAITDGLGDLATGAEQLNQGVSQLSEAISAAASTGGNEELANALAALGVDLYTISQDPTGATWAGALASAANHAAQAQAADATIGGGIYACVVTGTESGPSLVASGNALAADLAAVAQKAQAMQAAQMQMAAAQAALDAPQANLGAASQTFSADLQALGAALQGMGDLGTAAANVLNSGGALLQSLNVANPSSFPAALGNYQDAAEAYQQTAAEYQEVASTQAEDYANFKMAMGQCAGYLQGVSNTSDVYGAQVASSLGSITQVLDTQLGPGAQALSQGASQLQDGSASLTVGIRTAADGSQKLTYSLGQVVSGANSLATGLDTAGEALDELHDGLAEGQENMADSADNATARAEMMSEPVTANGDNATGESITQVSNYGTGFAPYFIGLGLWVGALMISFLIRSLNGRILMSRSSSLAAVLSSYVPMVLIAWIQVVVLLVFIQFGLGFNVNFPLWYYLFGLLVAAAFVAIIQFLRATMGTAGMVVAVILLMLQLCTAAGTFPIEAELPAFGMISPFMPMTYVVDGFRMAMCGLSTSYMVADAIALAVFAVLFLFLSTCWAHYRNRASMTVLYPKIKMAG